MENEEFHSVLLFCCCSEKKFDLNGKPRKPLAFTFICLLELWCQFLCALDEREAICG